MRKFFNLKELINKIASNCYLILVWNSEISNLPSPINDLKYIHSL
jgi:hypothetical protein